MRFAIPFEGVSTGSTPGTYKTIALVVVPDTAGYRSRIVEVDVHGADATLADEKIDLRVTRIADISAGGAGTGTSVTPVKLDLSSRASVITAKVNCTVEPTTYESTNIWNGAIHMKSGIERVFGYTEIMPVLNRDEALGLLGSPLTANARKLSGQIIIEEF